VFPVVRVGVEDQLIALDPDLEFLDRLIRGLLPVRLQRDSLLESLDFHLVRRRAVVRGSRAAG
jgi:hypothetical protein